MLQWIRKFYKNIFQKQSQIEPIADNEILARFIFNKKQLNASGAKAAAFLPPSDNLKTSVFRKTRMTEENYQNVKNSVSEKRAQTHKATALLMVPDVLSVGLLVEPEESDYKWHADLVNWPDEKDERKSVAQELALVSQVIER